MEFSTEFEGQFKDLFCTFTETDSMFMNDMTACDFDATNMLSQDFLQANSPIQSLGICDGFEPSLGASDFGFLESMFHTQPSQDFKYAPASPVSTQDVQNAPASPPSSPAAASVSPSTESDKPLTASQKKRIRESARNLTCHNCKTSKTPLWRRSNCKQFNLCNACGLYEKQYGEHRPVSYIHKPQRANRIQSRFSPSFNVQEFVNTICRQEGVIKDGTVTLKWSQLERLLLMAKSL